MIACLFLLIPIGYAQQKTTTEDEKPTIVYSGTPKKYEIADIQVEGVKNYEDYALISLSGLAVGQEIDIPGTQITDAINRYWKHGLFSNVKITAEKIEGSKIWLKIALAQRPRISEINYNGIKKSEKKDLESKLGMIVGSQITPHTVNRAELLTKRYFEDKGFKNATVLIAQRDDPNKENQVLVDVNIDKKEKIKVHKIYIEGNEALKDSKVKRAMKKTNEKGPIRNWFKTKKFIPENFSNDKKLIIDKYNELGYRDARIVKDSIVPFNEKTVDVHLDIEEGKKYFIRNISWVGNTLYPTEQLEYMLQMKKGDVYNQKLLTDRTVTDDDAIGNLYYNNGYIFYNLSPVEVNIIGDSIDLEMRIHEGRPATINKIKINGNDRLYENVVRRELRTKPGELFSKENIMRSLREIQQMGHFDPENIQPDIQPNPEDATVDIAYDLVSKANDQVEFSAGWGQTGVIGKLSLKFTNFSMANLFHPGKNYRGILPQGDGQTLTISGQTNAKYYQSYSISFFDPWFGGKRPNSFSLSAYYSVQTDVSSNWYSNSYYNNMYNMGYMGGYGGGYGGYNNYGYENFYDPDKSMKVFGISAGWGKRLTWPDDYFTLSANISFQRYIMRDWQYFLIRNGNSNNLSVNITLARASFDNPIFPRQGSDFSLSVQFTPPYSLWDGKKYNEMNDNNENDLASKHRWIEYHKWKFKSKTYTSLMDYTRYKRVPVLMTRAEIGILGHYNSHKRSPFETFEMGGDGMSGYSGYATEMIALRGYDNNSLTPYGGGYAYTRLGLELRYPLMLEPSTSIYVLGFLEGGNAWNRVKDFNPFDLKRSAGIGVRIFLPMIGMMGIDWGYGFDKVDGSAEKGGSQFHFILGQEF
ncbi:outer membrane protein assembly factor BamA [Bacteroides sp.]|uniref:outer membrane protein assembly factor BamA n=1 Tax=Bacteroides sp. TaxID=29523 RepID=UPI0025855F94|nr:outer membrane protein assembly factor BamA [Bacteroides sp.]